MLDCVSIFYLRDGGIELTIYIHTGQNPSIDNLEIERVGPSSILRRLSVVLLLMSMRRLILLSRVRSFTMILVYCMLLTCFHSKQRWLPY